MDDTHQHFGELIVPKPLIDQDSTRNDRQIIKFTQNQWWFVFMCFGREKTRGETKKKPSTSMYIKVMYVAFDKG